MRLQPLQESPCMLEVQTCGDDAKSKVFPKENAGGESIVSSLKVSHHRTLTTLTLQSGLCDLIASRLYYKGDVDLCVICRSHVETISEAPFEGSSRPGPRDFYTLRPL